MSPIQQSIANNAGAASSASWLACPSCGTAPQPTYYWPAYPQLSDADVDRIARRVVELLHDEKEEP